MRAGVQAFAVAAFALLLGVFVWQHHHSVYDDAFIYLRYVRNVHAGCGLRWNCTDPPVEGFSSPLYLALLLAGSVVTTKLVLLTTVVSTAALFGAGLLAIVAAAPRRPGRPALAAASAIAIAAVLGLDHFVLLNGVIGLDSGLAALLVVATWASVDRGRPRLAAVVAVLAVLARPEALILAVLLPLFVRRARVAVIVIVLGGLLAMTLARWATFHDLLPNTYWAKSGGTTAHARLGAEYLLLLATDFPVVVLAPLALLDRRHRASSGYLLIASAVWCGLFLRTGGDTFAYSRLAFPLVPALAVLAVRGVCALLARRARTPRWLALAPFAAIAIRAGLVHRLPEQHGFPNVNAWVAVGRYLERDLPGRTIATVPIGAIGYTSKLRVIDLVGLTDRAIAKAGRSVPPELLSRGWLGHERHDLEYVTSLAPDVIVTTKYRETPWNSLEETSAGFYADWLLLRAIKEGRLRYHVVDAPIAPRAHWLLLVRDD